METIFKDCITKLNLTAFEIRFMTRVVKLTGRCKLAWSINPK